MKKRIGVKTKMAVALAMIFTVIAFGVVSGDSTGPFGDRIDAVIMKGKSLPASILGAPIDNYGLYAANGSAVEPIPFQVDEYDDKDEILMQKGPRPRPDSDNGAFDGNDELVFMASDAGGKVSAKPAIDGCGSVVEIGLSDSKSGAKGYVYLAKCSAAPQKSGRRYIQWNAKNSMAITKRYKMGFQKGPNFHYDYMSTYGGPDLLDRLKVRVSVGRGRLRKVFNEENHFKNKIQGYIYGPVRISYSNLSKIGLGPFGAIPVPQHIFFYRDYVYLNNWIDSRFNPAVMGLDFEIGIMHDLELDRSKNYKLCANVVPNCEVIDGRMTPEREALKQKELRWGGVSGSSGAVITKFIMDPQLPTRSMGIYEDDPNRTNKPEFIPGSNPEVGFLVVDLKKAPKGIFFLDFYHYFMKKYSKAEFDRLDRLTTNPLKVKPVAL